MKRIHKQVLKNKVHYIITFMDGETVTMNRRRFRPAEIMEALFDELPGEAYENEEAFRHWLYRLHKQVTQDFLVAKALLVFN